MLPAELSRAAIEKRGVQTLRATAARDSCIKSQFVLMPETATSAEFRRRTSPPEECAKSGYLCATGSLSEADGVRAGKNVLFATVRKEDGTLASSRLRFAGSTSAASTSTRASAMSSARPAAVAPSNGIADTFFTPPTVKVTTLTPGGWNGNVPWISVGNEQLPGPNDVACSFDQPYMVVVLDRQTCRR